MRIYACKYVWVDRESCSQNRFCFVTCLTFRALLRNKSRSSPSGHCGLKISRRQQRRRRRRRRQRRQRQETCLCGRRHNGGRCTGTRTKGAAAGLERKRTQTTLFFCPSDTALFLRPPHAGTHRARGTMAHAQKGKCLLCVCVWQNKSARRAKWNSSEIRTIIPEIFLYAVNAKQR